MSYISVWRWADAPRVYKKLSEHGGDEDWVAIVPKGMPVPGWLDVLDACREPQKTLLDTGETLVIGARA